MLDPGSADPLLGLAFRDSDEVIRAAIDQASVPALLMSMVHMTGDLTLLEQLPRPFMLIPMDLQGAMSEADKQLVRDRAYDVVRQYRDRGCPRPFIPDAAQMRVMLDAMSAGEVTDEYVDYVAADLRLTAADRDGPPLVSSPEQRAAFPVLVIGCGEAGLLAGIKLKQAGIPFTIVDKQAGVGGTWRANRYPGCRVDIANQYYCYSFEPTDHWTHHYSEQPEILTYLEDVMARHGIGAHTRFSTEVTSAQWDDGTATWKVLLRTASGAQEELRPRALICAVGQFSNAVIPDIEGAGTFAGPSFHTADWRDEVDLSGKRIAVIGAGASGFQLVPAIADVAGQIDVYQRTPQWMAPNVSYHEPVPDGDRWAIRHLPYYGRWLRFLSWWPLTDAAEERVMVDPQWDDGGLSCGPANHAVREMLIAWMRAFTDDEELLAKVIPDYPPMGKRMLQDNGTWLKTLQRDDVELIRDGIAAIGPQGVTTVDGVHRRADVLLWATGFDVNHQLGPVEVRGLGGLSLSEEWGDSAYAYLGITVPGFPNFYCMYGPGTNAVNGASIIYNSECQMRYILGCLDMVIARGARWAAPRAEVCRDYHRRNQERLKTMVYTHPKVISYYRNASGEVPTLYGFRIVDYWKWTNRPDPDDYEFSPPRSHR
ncbi:flavin-containing monooxygenase [Mycolicibacterium sp. D5.8-2]|uniref:flavin-containing monooxygenase n=1 Tax=Mycolicibacterium sp. D5.8-2 TaxID=3085903 RepID=UPI00399A34A4